MVLVPVQEMLKDKVRLTVALLNINWAGLRFDDTGNPLGNATSEGIKQAIQNAQQYVNVPQAASASASPYSRSTMTSTMTPCVPCRVLLLGFFQI